MKTVHTQLYMLHALVDAHCAALETAAIGLISLRAQGRTLDLQATSSSHSTPQSSSSSRDSSNGSGKLAAAATVVLLPAHAA